MSIAQPLPSVAIVGAGIAGAACAAGLRQSGLAATLFEKSLAAGGRMATRRISWTGADGNEQSAAFDHGAQTIAARQPRFRAVLARAEAAGVVARWRPRVHAAWPAAGEREVFVGTPGMPALARHLAQGVPLRPDQAVQRLHRTAAGWQPVLAGGAIAGTFDHVILALPPAQAAVLLAGHQDVWADALASLPVAPCWTLMAATNDIDWPWDAVEPDRGPLAWVARNDRKPGRRAPPGVATWVAHATPAWSTSQADPAAVNLALGAALRDLLPARLPGGRSVNWLHRAVHRWRYAAPVAAVGGAADCWWDGGLGIGVCGDSFGAGDVESAWRSGDELADTVVAWLEQEPAVGGEAVAEAEGLASA